MAQGLPDPIRVPALADAEGRIRVVALTRVGALANDVADVQVFGECIDTTQIDDGRERGDAFEHGAGRGRVDAKALGCGVFDGQILQPEVVAVNRHRAPTGAGQIQVRPVARRRRVVEEVDIQLVVRGVLPRRARLGLDVVD